MCYAPKLNQSHSMLASTLYLGTFLNRNSIVLPPVASTHSIFMLAMLYIIIYSIANMKIERVDATGGSTIELRFRKERKQRVLAGIAWLWFTLVASYILLQVKVSIHF